MAPDGLKCTVRGLKACTTYVARAVVVDAGAGPTAAPVATSPVSSYMMTLSEKVRGCGGVKGVCVGRGGKGYVTDQMLFFFGCVGNSTPPSW